MSCHFLVEFIYNKIRTAVQGSPFYGKASVADPSDKRIEVHLAALKWTGCEGLLEAAEHVSRVVGASLIRGETHDPVLCNLFNLMKLRNEFLRGKAHQYHSESKKKCTCLPCPLKKLPLTCPGSNREPSGPEWPTLPLELFVLTT